MNKSKSTSVVSETVNDAMNEQNGNAEEAINTAKEIDFGEDFREPRVVPILTVFEENVSKSRSRKLTKNATRNAPYSQVFKSSNAIKFSGGSKHIGTKSKKCKRKQKKKGGR
ncbi:hypothetical protein [Xenorhabdus griffiniae]|uniref:Uncharacterized protein n=1 Tax=Xenorhabdus griffiniae TaxID=351672 RepID=A0ABY9XKJ7_9GAMM|nr:hypothetical protein [Xenorhabdus griffiniae]MBD1228583.1 hypothetical protein [Xenorhabdus griffiniae]MBE8588680.1 hypothetical protein [Xenorhabdus griffiniae]WMV73458.1 hypothetical protein QL128_05380 [Xenorhabdus griffiniae]WNH03137.1 hypothetical protein QL112_005385 [Xenorhabdus griffiniae]